MKASIHSAEETFPVRNKSKGKTLSVSRGPITSIKAVSRGSEIVSLEIVATRSHNPGTGERGGKFKAFDDKLTLDLEAKDLTDLLAAALKHGLISVHFKPKSER